MSEGNAGRLARRLVCISVFAAAMGCSKAKLDYRVDGGPGTKQFLTDGSSMSVIPTGGTTPATVTVADPVPSGPVVCDPFGNSGSGALYGLKGTFYYDDTCGCPTDVYQHLDQYFTQGIKLPYDVYIKDVEFPSADIHNGFKDTAGEALTAAHGRVMSQWFAASFLSNLTLSDKDAEGDYQIALLNNDGGEVLVGDGEGGYSPVVDNDGLHTTSLACSMATVHLTHGMSVPLKVLLFHGSDPSLTFMMLWRKVDATTDLTDPACGVSGSVDLGDWFGAHATRYECSLRDAGWVAPQNDNFLLTPAAQALNACSVNGSPR